MKNLEWAKKNALQLIIILGFIVFGVYTCNRGGGGNTPKADTVYSSHTQYIQQPPVYIPQYIPQQTSSSQPIIIPPQYAPNTANMEALLKQYNELANKFLAQNRYLDSIPLKDSTGKRVGVVNLDDLISENQIKSRKPSYQLTFPVTTNTVTITKYAPNKNKLYIGASLEGGTTNILSSVGAGVMLNTKKDALWGAKVSYNFAGGVSYELSRYWKIHIGR